MRYRGRAPLGMIRAMADRARAMDARVRISRPDEPGLSALRFTSPNGRGEAKSRPRKSARYRAAMTMISTPYFGPARLTSTVARAGVFPGDTQPSHTAFISAKFFMSVM